MKISFRHLRADSSRGDRDRPSHSRVLALAVLASLLCCSTIFFNPGAVRADVAAEDVKAAFVYQFTKFIDWPHAETSPDDPFVVGVSAPADVYQSFARILSGRLVNDRRIEVRPYQVKDSPKLYDIVFFAGPFSGQLAQGESDSHALTIGDGDHFLDSGGLIEFVHQGNRIRFKINASRARARGFMMSSKLLSLATEVR